MAYFGTYETKRGVLWYYKSDSKHTKRGFKTKRDAVKHYKESDYSKLQGIEIKNNVLFEDMVNIWLSDYVNSGVKESTIENRRSRGLPNLLKYYEGKRLNEITADNYFELLQQLKNRGYKKNTIHGIKSAMSLIIRDAVRRGFLTYNPIQYVKMPRFVVSVKDSKEELNDSYLSNSEIKDLTLKIDNYSDIIYRTLFQVMLQTGMRVSEVLALKKEDIDCDNNVIKVYKTLYRPGNAIKNYELTSPKTRFSTRAVYVSEELIDKLKILIKLIENERRVEVFKVDHDFLFIYLKSRFRGYPITKGQVNRRLLKVIEKTTIKKEFTSHKFRHVHITQLAEAGVSLKAIKERVGHIDSKVTEQIYLHVTQEERKNIPEKLQLFLNQV